MVEVDEQNIDLNVRFDRTIVDKQYTDKVLHWIIKREANSNNETKIPRESQQMNKYLIASLVYSEKFSIVRDFR